MFGGALSWAHYKIRGGGRNIALTVAAYVILAATVILLALRSSPSDRAWSLDRCTDVLIVLQAVTLVLVGGNAVRNSIRKDLTSGMIQSHRLMPVSGPQAVTGYIVGSTSQAIAIAVANLIIGLFTTAGGSGSQLDWLMDNAALGAFAVLAWTAIALLSFLTPAATGLLVMFIIFAIATGGLIVSLLPALTVLLTPALSAAFSGTGPSIDFKVSLPAQAALAMFCFVGAARKFHREDVLPFTPLMGLALVAFWATLTWLGIVSMDRFFGSAGPRSLGPGDPLPPAVQIVSSTLLGVLVAIVPVMASARLAAAHHQRRLLRDVAIGSRPLSPNIMVLAVTVILCTIPLALIAREMRVYHSPWTSTMTRNLGYTAVTIALNLITISYLMRILYRVTGKSAVMVFLFVLCTWIGPLALDFIRFGLSGMQPLDDIVTGLSACGPVGTMILIWGQFQGSVELGLSIQACCAAIFALLFHGTQPRKVVPEARAAGLALGISHPNAAPAAPPEEQADSPSP